MKYQVTYYYQSSVTVEVEANSKEEAIDLGYDVSVDEGACYQIISNLQECGDPDIKEVGN